MDATGRISTMTGNGSPPSAAATLYPGEVMHARLKPFGHRFRYSVFSLLLDVDRVEEAGRLSWLFRVNRRGVASFHESDHLPAGRKGLRVYAEGLLGGAGIHERPHRIVLMTYPRILGYVFNPISLWFAYRADGSLLAVIYAVRNTFGERHAYVAPVLPGELTEAGLRQTRSKAMHVSPFIGMEARYEFRVMPPGKALKLRIHETELGEPVLAATFSGRAAPLNDRVLAKCLLKMPLMTWKIMAGIHWEALKLWLKGARFHTSPPPPAEASYADLHDAVRLSTGGAVDRG